MSSDFTEPNFGVLLDWLEDRLPMDQAAQVEAALAAGGPALQGEVAWLRAFLASSEYVQFTSSPALQAKLTHMFEDYARQHREPSLLRRYIASLVSDNRLRLGTASGTRGAASDASRQLLYSAEVADIVLNLKAKPGKASIEGQIFSSIDAPFGSIVVQLLRDSVESDITTTSPTGHFAFIDLSPGRYDLIAVTDQFEVQLTAVDVDVD